MELCVEHIAPGWQTRLFTEADIPAILKLCRGNPAYYRHMGMEPTAGNLREVFTALPPGKGLEDKYFLGFFRGGDLAALLDLVAAYPDKETAFIGWFMVEKSLQGAGVGTGLVTDLLAFLAEAGFRRVRLGYVIGNRESEAFWRKNGFRPTGQEIEGPGYRAAVAERTLGEGDGGQA